MSIDSLKTKTYSSADGRLKMLHELHETKRGAKLVIHPEAKAQEAQFHYESAQVILVASAELPRIQKKIGEFVQKKGWVDG